MSQDLLKGTGGVVETEFLSGRPTACTFQLVASNGEVLVDEAAVTTVDSVNTVTTAAAARRATTVALASVIGIATDGRRYLFDGEEVTVRSVSGSNVTLWAPLMLDHASGAVFQGCRVTFTVQAADADDEFWDAKGIFTPTGGGGEPQVEVVHCTWSKIPMALFGLQDIRDANPMVELSVSSSLNLPRSIRVARDRALMLIGTKNRAQKHLGVDYFRPFAAKVWWTQRRQEYGENWGPELDKVEGEMTADLDRVLGQAPQNDGAGGTLPGPGGAIFPNFSLSTGGR